MKSLMIVFNRGGHFSEFTQKSELIMFREITASMISEVLSACYQPGLFWEGLPF